MGAYLLGTVEGMPLRIPPPKDEVEFPSSVSSCVLDGEVISGALSAAGEDGGVREKPLLSCPAVSTESGGVDSQARSLRPTVYLDLVAAPVTGPRWLLPSLALCRPFSQAALL